MNSVFRRRSSRAKQSRVPDQAASVTTESDESVQCLDASAEVNVICRTTQHQRGHRFDAGTLPCSVWSW